MKTCFGLLFGALLLIASPSFATGDEAKGDDWTLKYLVEGEVDLDGQKFGNASVSAKSTVWKGGVWGNVDAYAAGNYADLSGVDDDVEFSQFAHKANITAYASAIVSTVDKNITASAFGSSMVLPASADDVGGQALKDANVSATVNVDQTHVGGNASATAIGNAITSGGN